MQILGQWAGEKPRQSLKGSKEGEETAKEAVASRNSLTGLLMSRSESAVAAAKDPSPASPIPDIDSKDRANPLAASAYVGDIFAYYRRVEPIFRTSPDYMKEQVLLSCSTHCKQRGPSLYRRSILVLSMCVMLMPRTRD